MNLILCLVVLVLGLKTAYDFRNVTISIPWPHFRKTKKRSRVFKTFKAIDTNHGMRIYEESRMI